MIRFVGFIPYGFGTGLLALAGDDWTAILNLVAALLGTLIGWLASRKKQE